MDGHHAMGSSLIGIAISVLMVRIFWMSSPPFKDMRSAVKTNWKAGLVAITIGFFAWGGWELSKPIDAAAAAERAAAKEGFEFH